MKIVPAVRALQRNAKAAKSKAQALVATEPKLKFYYWYFCKYCRVDSKRMLFESFHGKGISDSSYAVLQYMVEHGIARDYEIFYATNNLERDQPFVKANNLPVKLVDVNSPQYVYVLATAKYLLNNSSFPLYFIRRPEQTYVQTWHGTPLKTLGKEMRQGMESMVNVQHNFLQANWLTFPNDFTRDVIMRDYNLDALFTGKVAMVGYPRNTVFLKGGDPELRARYNLDGFTTYAYMPTWRGKSNHDVEVTIYADFLSQMLRELDAHLADDQKVFVNFHSMVAASITLDSYEHIFPFPTDVATYDFLSQLDVLITDYSSVMFDYALTGKPVVLFTYDEEQYLADRGMYFPLSDLPFANVKTTDELVRCLREQSYAIEPQKLDALRNAYLRYDSLQNSKYVLDLLLGDVPEGVPVLDFAHNREKAWQLVHVEPQVYRVDLNGIFLSSGADDLVMLNRYGFGPVKSAHVYDTYRDRVFVFRTPTTPRTFAEDVTRRFFPPTQKRLDVRERQRVLGDLTTRPTIRTTALAGEANTTYSEGLDIELCAAFEVVGSRLLVAFVPDGYTPQRVMLVTNQRIRWARSLTPEELDGCYVDLDLLQPLCDPLFLARGRDITDVCLLACNNTTGQSYVARLHVGDGKRDFSERYAKPISISPDYVASVLPLDERGKTGSALVDKANGRELSCTAFEDTDGILRVLHTYRNHVANSYLTATAVSVRTPGQNDLKVSIRIDGGAPIVQRVELRNRMAGSSTVYELDFYARDMRNGLMVEATFDPKGKTYDGIFWDLYLVVSDQEGLPANLSCGTSDALRHSFYFRNLQCVLEDGNILFPYPTVTTRLALCHRPLHASDTLATKAKEWAAVGAYLALLPYWKSRKIWLVYEKFCSLAQDNGFAFFQYCMEREANAKTDHVYYVMDRDSTEYGKVAPYAKNVVDFMSFRHMLYALAASIYVGSDAKSHLYQWRPKASVVRRLLARHEVLFLQHGVTAMKRVDYLFGKQGSNPMTYFLTTSHAEQDIVLNNFGYDIRHSPVLGFSRWDLLTDTSNKQSPSILLMPTWRQWLEDVGDEAFLQSDYYQAYASLIQSDGLDELLKAHDATLKFFIHPKFSAQLQHFDHTSKRVELIDMGSRPLNELIMECSMLVTDYSSVCWDVLYMDKPVVFYQFDQGQYVDEVGSYVNLNADLPGLVCFTQDALLDAVKATIEQNFALDKRAQEVASRWFDFKDKNNRRRTYDFLADEGYLPRGTQR